MLMLRLFPFVDLDLIMEFNIILSVIICLKISLFDIFELLILIYF